MQPICLAFVYPHIAVNLSISVNPRRSSIVFYYACAKQQLNAWAIELQALHTKSAFTMMHVATRDSALPRPPK